jgi:hypothetical protein
MSLLLRSIRRLLIVSLLVLCVQVSRGTVYNWSTTPAFPAGPTPGNSVSALYQGLGAVTIKNNADPSTGTGGVWDPGHPQVNSTDTTGGNHNINALQLYLDSQPTVNSNIQVNIVFGYTGGATNVSLVIWDVDAASNFTDKISNIVGVTANGTLVAATVTGSPDNTVTGSGTLSATATGKSSSGNTAASANVTISFGATAIQSVQFIWSDDNPTTRTTQVIGISPITFTPVGSATPEIGSSLGALVACLGVVGGGSVMRRRRARKQIPVTP